ncbi:MAG: hypothetical protein JSS32_08995 [Verrucomicrobia bacterium]|nr:hypothetical protein [Verrucomicrobiota bacterium]
MEGIVVGCDQNQEWLLPWWWDHYSATNSYPVLFVDFGLSNRAKRWCSERGICQPLATFSKFREHPIAEEKRKKWEGYITSIFSIRTALFKKPFALLQSPFPLTLWIDLDCQVLGSLEPLFSFLHLGIEILVRRNRSVHEEHHVSHGILAPGEKSYNSGVVGFHKNGPLISAWAQEILERNQEYITDEHALSRVLLEKSPRLMELPPIYNWNPLYGPNPEAVVIHYQGGLLKEKIRAFIH